MGRREASPQVLSIEEDILQFEAAVEVNISREWSITHAYKADTH